MQPHITSILIALVALAAPTATAHDVAESAIDAQSRLDCSLIIHAPEDPTQFLIHHECLGPYLNPVQANQATATSTWVSGDASADGGCALLKPGVNPDRFPYVFVIIQEECLGPLRLFGDVGVEGRLWW